MVGSGQYRNKSLTDASVFDFYNKLIDGNNKKEWEEWDAYNVTLTQTGWDDRVGLEVAFDKQEYTRGGFSIHSIHSDTDHRLHDERFGLLHLRRQCQRRDFCD